MALFELADIEEEDVMTAEDSEIEDEPCEYGIDFETGQLTGEKVYGVDALAVWAWLALQTNRYECMLYSDDYGCEVEPLIGSKHSTEYYESLIQAMMTECVTQHEQISGIDNFECEITDNSIKCSFEIITDFGSTDELEVEYGV